MTQRIQDVPGSSGLTDTSRSSDVSSEVDPQGFGATVSSIGGGVARLTFCGDIDLAVRDRLRQLVEAGLATEGVKALLIDMAAVTFLDCGGIGVLIAGRHLAADVGCGYGVVNTTGIVARVLDLTRVRSLLELSPAGADGLMAAGMPRQ